MLAIPRIVIAGTEPAWATPVPAGSPTAAPPKAIESGRPVAHIAADIGLPKETLRKAVRKAEADEGLQRRADQRGA